MRNGKETRADKAQQYLYRFRPCKSLLGRRFQELKRQEIYLSTLSQLNDPMEGFRDLYWSGDEVVWNNLLRHYLLCLTRTHVLALLRSPDQEIDNPDIPIHITDIDSRTQAYADIYGEICRMFFSVPAIKTYAKKLAARKSAIRREELRCHLSLLHPYALDAVLSVHEHRGYIPKRPDDDFIRTQARLLVLDYFAAIGQIEGRSREQGRDPSEAIDGFFLALDVTRTQHLLDAIHRNPSGSLDRTLRSLYFDFCDGYVELLDRLVYCESYIACFCDNCSNSSMWGHYADAHRGVCLKFKCSVADGQPTIRLFSTLGSRYVAPVNDWTFHRVHYGMCPEINFFKSIGRVSNAGLRFWYSDASGTMSACADGMVNNIEQWREEYRDTLIKTVTTKLDDWSYEREFRLVFAGAFDHPDPVDRRYMYDFQALDGIIFGINTSESDKLSIVSMIEGKCRREKRERFNFYQAHFNRRASKVDVLPLFVGEYAAPPSALDGRPNERAHP